MPAKIEFARTLLEKQSTPTLFANPRPPKFSAVADNLEYRRIGLELLRANKVAVLMVAGGLSTRMELPDDVLRGDLSIGPVTTRTIFDVHGESLAAIKHRYSPLMSWLVMTSQPVHEMTVASFKGKNFYGIPRSHIWFFVQDSLPLIDGNGQPIIEKGKPALSPAGHGSVLATLQNNRILNKLHRFGIEYLFSFQYPNVLEKICDPLMLGFHHAGGHDITTKATFDYDQSEKMGRCVHVDGRLRIIEYHDLKHYAPEFLLNAVPASLATHVWSISFLDRCVKEGVQLPYHLLEQSASCNAPKPIRKFEQFIFDLFPYAGRNELYVVSRWDEFAPVKEKHGLYSLESARTTLNRRYLRWMRETGAINREGSEDCTIEIRPSFALDFHELKARIPAGFEYGDSTVLS